MSDDRNPNQALKVTLTRAALERLIGDDAQMQVVLTKAAVREVVDRHMQTVTDAVESAIKEMLRSAIGEVVEKWSGGSRTSVLQLSDIAKSAINATIKPSIDACITSYLNDQAESIKAYADSAVDKAAKSRIEREASDRVAAIIRAAAARVGNS